MKSRCCVSKDENNMTLIVLIHLHQCSWVTRYIIWAVIFWKKSFFWVVTVLLLLNSSIEPTSLVVLNSRPKIFSKPCCKQMCWHLGFVSLLTGHLQSRLRIILKGPRIGGIVISTGFNLKSSAALAHNKRVSLSLKALKPGVDFSLAVKVLDGIFLLPVEGYFLYTVYESVFLFSVATFINYLFYIFRITCCNFYINTRSVSLYCHIMEAASLLKSHEPTSASFQHSLTSQL